MIRETKKGLRHAKERLAGGAAGMDGGRGGGKRGEMAGLWNKERVVRDTLKLLDTMCVSVFLLWIRGADGT